MSHKKIEKHWGKDTFHHPTIMGDQEVAEHWDKNATYYAKAVREKHDLYRELINNPAFFELLGEVNNLRMLDVGCGEGITTRMLADRGAKVTGIDLSEKMIELAKQHDAKESCGIQYALTSGSDLSQFESETFDAAVSTMAMMDMADYAACVKEVYRVLKPSGFFQFSILHPCFFTHAFKWILDKEGKRDGLVTGDYFSLDIDSETTPVDQWFFSGTSHEERENHSPLQVPRFPKTLSQYFNVLTQTGFVVENLKEPFADEKVIIKHPEIADSRVISYFLIFRCRKCF